jgi:hypothetical protein
MTTTPNLPPGRDIESRVSPPAVAIMVVAGIAIAFSLLGLLMNALGMGAGMLGDLGHDERIAGLMGGTIGIVVNVLSLLFYGVAIYGALKMKGLESYAMSVASSVLVMLPCSCCCLAGLPVGIWALVVLLDANVKAAFRS